MKYLSDYIQGKTSQALNSAGAFFCFSKERFLEQRIEGVVYVDCGGGLTCPKDKAAELTTALDKIVEEGIRQDIEENGKEAIIERELYNHEAFYTGDITDTVESLAGYGINADDVQAVYWKIRRKKQAED